MGTHLNLPPPEICHSKGTPSLRAASPNTVRGSEELCNNTKPACLLLSSQHNSPKQRQVKQSGQLGELDWEGEAMGYKNVTSS